MSLVRIVDVLFHRQRRVFIAVFVAAVAAAAAVTFSLPDEYEATATLFVGENRPISTGANAVQLDEVLAETYKNLLDTVEVVEQVRRSVPFQITRAELVSEADFTVLTGTRLIEITVLDRDPSRASVIANAYADAFVRGQERGAQEAGRGELDRLGKRIGELAAEINRLQNDPSPAAAATLERRRTELSAASDAYRETQQQVALQGRNVSVSSRATLPTSPAKPRPKLYMAIGIVLALILASVAALLRNTFDKRIRTEDELVEVVDVPVLTRVPFARGRGVGRSDFNEAFQFLRANLQAHEHHGKARAIAVTSPLPGDGKSTVVTNLARALAGGGSNRVIAVDCDLRKPALAGQLGVETRHGVTDVLIGSRTEDEVLAGTETPGLRVMASGPLPPNPSVLLSMPVFHDLLRRLREKADYVIVDLPPVTAGAESASVAAAVDAVVLVVDLERSRRDALIVTASQLANVGARLAGIVLNRVPDRLGAYAYYGGYRAEEGASPTGAEPERPERERAASHSATK